MCVQLPIRVLASVLVPVGFALWTTGGARAQSICIVCEDPHAVYSCAAQDPTSLKTSDPRLQVACVAELAKAGGHGSCSASRRQTGAACEGPLRTIAVGDAPAVPPPAAAASAPAPQGQAEAKQGTPSTVEELAKRTAQSSKEQLKKAGDGVSGAAKKTWNCVTSLFKDC